MTDTKIAATEDGLMSWEWDWTPVTFAGEILCSSGGWRGSWYTPVGLSKLQQSSKDALQATAQPGISAMVDAVTPPSHAAPITSPASGSTLLPRLTQNTSTGSITAVFPSVYTVGSIPWQEPWLSGPLYTTLSLLVGVQGSEQAFWISYDSTSASGFR